MQTRLGVEATLFATPSRPTSFWARSRLGGEWLRVLRQRQVEGMDGEVSADDRLFAFPDVAFQVGVAFAASSLTLAPFAGFSFATFTSVTSDRSCSGTACAFVSADPTDEAIPSGDRSSHQWLSVGVMGAFAL